MPSISRAQLQQPDPFRYFDCTLETSLPGISFAASNVTFLALAWSFVRGFVGDYRTRIRSCTMGCMAGTIREGAALD